MNNNRNNLFSIAKGIGIILMVMGHCGAPDIFVKFIYLFHMPLFFFCSGYFLKDINKTSTLFLTYKKKIKGIYVKFVIWSLIFLALHNIFYHLNIYNDVILFQGQPSYLYTLPDYIKKSTKIILSMNEHEQLVRSFWFLKQLFIASILTTTILYITNKLSSFKHTNLIILVLLFALSIISKIYCWTIPAIWDISLVFLSSSFFLSGKVFREYCILDSLPNFWVSTSCIFLLTIALFTLPWTNMLEYTSLTIMPFSIASFSGIILTLSISRKFEEYKIKKIFYYLGQNTMVIFVLHMLSFKIVNLIKIAIFNWPIYRLAEFQIIYENNNIFWIVYTIIGISIPLLIDRIMKNNKYTNKFWGYLV